MAISEFGLLILMLILLSHYMFVEVMRWFMKGECNESVSRPNRLLSGPRVFMTSSYRPNSGGIKEI